MQSIDRVPDTISVDQAPENFNKRLKLESWNVHLDHQAWIAHCTRTMVRRLTQRKINNLQNNLSEQQTNQKYQLMHTISSSFRLKNTKINTVPR